MPNANCHQEKDARSLLQRRIPMHLLNKLRGKSTPTRSLAKLEFTHKKRIKDTSVHRPWKIQVLAINLVDSYRCLLLLHLHFCDSRAHLLVGGRVQKEDRLTFRVSNTIIVWVHSFTGSPLGGTNINTTTARQKVLTSRESIIIRYSRLFESLLSLKAINASS
jgi:hypothetical protein